MKSKGLCYILQQPTSFLYIYIAQGYVLRTPIQCKRVICVRLFFITLSQPRIFFFSSAYRVQELARLCVLCTWLKLSYTRIYTFFCILCKCFSLCIRRYRNIIFVQVYGCCIHTILYRKCWSFFFFKQTIYIIYTSIYTGIAYYLCVLYSIRAFNEHKISVRYREKV